MELQTRSHSLVVKSNQLINARYSLSLFEVRLFLMMVAQVERDDHDFKPYRIHIKDYAKAVGTNSKSHYKEIREAAQNLLSRIVDIPKDDGGWIKMAFLSSAEYFKGKGVIELCFDPKLKPYLLELKSRFTAYDIRNVLTLQSSYSIRIYELLKQFEKIGERTFVLSRLRDILGIGPNQYKRYNDFKRFVILQAYEELKKHTDICFEFKEIKEGRRITAIRFIIQRQMMAFSDLDLSPDEGVIQQLKDMGLSPKQAQRFARERSRKEILQAISYTQERYREGKIKSSVGGYLKKILEEQAKATSSFEEQEQSRQSEVVKQKKTVRQKKQQQSVQLENWRQEYEQLKDKQLTQLASVASEKQWKAFQNWAEDNPYIRSKIIVQGKIDRLSPETLEWLKSYLGEELLQNGGTFQMWLKKEKGIDFSE